MHYLLIGANLLMVGAFIFTYQHLPPQVPIFYSHVWGEDQLADLWMLVIFPVFLNGLYVLNRILQKKIFPDNRLIISIIKYLNLFLIISLPLIFLKIVSHVS